MIDCVEIRTTYPGDPRSAVGKMPKCLQIFFSRDIPQDTFDGDIAKACKVVLLGIRTVYGDLDGPVFEGMMRILSKRQGLDLSRLMELAVNLPDHADFHCDLIKKHSDFHEEAKCSLQADYTRLIDMDPNDRSVRTVEVTWTELSISTIPSEIVVYCEANDYEQPMDLVPNHRAIKMIGGLTAHQQQQFVKQEFGLAVCPKCNRRKLRFHPSKYQDVLVLVVKDLDTNVESWEHEVEETIPAYIFPKSKREEKQLVRRIETANKITMSIRMILRNTKINVAVKMLECVTVHDTDKRFSYTSVSEEMQKDFRMKLGGSYSHNLEILKNSFAGWIGGRDWEKEVFLIWCFSAPFDPMTIIFIGDSRVGKSDIFISALSYNPKFEDATDNKAADCDVVLQGENIRRTVFYIHRRDPNGEFKLVKGKALRAQHGRLFIDSVTQCNQEIIGVTREAIPQGKMIVGGAGATQTRSIDFVTRYGVTINMKQEFGNYPTRYVAWREGIPDLFTYFDLKRFSLVIPFAQEDVKAAKMRDTYDLYQQAKIIGLSSEEFRMLKIFCDGLDQDNFFWESGVEEALGNLYEKKMRKYEYSYIHPYSADLRLHMRKMIKGIAFIGFNIAGDGRFHIKREHVRRLENILDEYETAWEFDLMLLEEQEFKHTITEVYYKLQGMRGKAPKRYKIFAEIARRGSITLEDLARETMEEKMDVWTNVNILIRDELVGGPTRSRYTLTQLGTEVYKRIIEDMRKFIRHGSENDDVTDLVLSGMHGCKTDNAGRIAYNDIIWICPGLKHEEIFNAVQILKERGLINEAATGKFDLM